MTIKRDDYVRQLIIQKDKDIIKVVTGFRRSGKSVLLFKLFYRHLISVGVKESQIIKIAFDSRVHKHLTDAESLYNHIKALIKGKKKYYLMLDEIQLVENFEEVVNDLNRDFNTDIYLTGSNSKMLSKEIHTIFRGRAIEIKVYPLSFSEYYSHYTGVKRDTFNDYVLYGGLPYLLQERDKQSRLQYLDMISKTVTTKDIIERHTIKNTEAFEAVVNVLCSSIGSYVSANKIANTLKSNGFKTINHETVGDYLSYLCDSFLFYKVQRYDVKGKEYLKSLHKYYVVDIGVRNARLNYRQLEITHTIENIVYFELLKRGLTVDIGKNNEKEIDFVAKNFSDTYYIQVSFTLSDKKVQEREIKSFYNLDDGYKKIIITMDDDPFSILERGYKKINLIDFLLDDNSLLLL